MRKVFYSLVVVASIAFIFTSCDKNDDHKGSRASQDIEGRATALGFNTVQEYQTSVANECALGNHENCDILTDGSHAACAYADHSGVNHDGTNHNGLNHNHSNHDANGHDGAGHNNHNGENGNHH